MLRNKGMLILCQALTFTLKIVNIHIKDGNSKKIKIEEANVIEGQETIPFGSRLEDELPTEVQIIRLSNADKDIVHSA